MQQRDESCPVDITPHHRLATTSVSTHLRHMTHPADQFYQHPEGWKPPKLMKKIPGITFQVSTGSACTDRRVSNEPLSTGAHGGGGGGSCEGGRLQDEAPSALCSAGQLTGDNGDTASGRSHEAVFLCQHLCTFENKAAALFKIRCEGAEALFKHGTDKVKTLLKSARSPSLWRPKPAAKKAAKKPAVRAASINPPCKEAPC